MNFEELWKIIVSKNAQLSNSDKNITLTKDGFKKALRLSFEQGVKLQKEVHDPKNNLYDAGADLFGNLFGGLKK